MAGAGCMHVVGFVSPYETDKLSQNTPPSMQAWCAWHTIWPGWIVASWSWSCPGMTVAPLVKSHGMTFRPVLGLG